MNLKVMLKNCFPVSVEVAAGQQKLKLWQIKVLMHENESIEWLVTIGNKTTSCSSLMECVEEIES